jgi:hypothetical protein
MPTAATGSTPTATSRLDGAERVELGLHPAQLAQHAAGDADDGDARRGGPHAARVPLEQRGARDLLQLAQAPGQRRLAEAQRGGGLEQAAVGVQRVGDAQQRQLQALVEEASGHGGVSAAPRPTQGGTRERGRRPARRSGR